MASLKLYKNLSKKDLLEVAKEKGETLEQYLNAIKNCYVILYDSRSFGYRPTSIEGWPIFYKPTVILRSIQNKTLSQSDVIMNAYEWCRLTIKGIE